MTSRAQAAPSASAAHRPRRIQSDARPPRGKRAAESCLALQRMQDAGLGPLGWLAAGYRAGTGKDAGSFAEFIVTRISGDALTRHRILRCRTAEEMRHVQSRFLAEAEAAYNAATGAHVHIATSPERHAHDVRGRQPIPVS